MNSTVVEPAVYFTSPDSSNDGGQRPHRTIHDLPNELLAEVLIWAACMTHGGSLQRLPPIVFRQVNKDLRTAALKTPELWANIHINLDDLRTEPACLQHVQYLTSARELSGTRPIDLVILNTSEKEHAVWLDSSLLRAISQIFRGDSRRIRSLKICSETMSLPELDGWLDTVFPRLDELVLDVKGAQKLVRAMPKKAPLLRTATVALHHFQMSSPVFPMTGRVWITPGNASEPYYRPALLMLNDAFRIFPRAVEMDVNLGRADFAGLPSAVIDSNKWTHHRVRILSIYTRRGFVQAAASYDFPSLEVLNIRQMPRSPAETHKSSSASLTIPTLSTGIWNFIEFSGSFLRHINIELPLTLDLVARNALRHAPRLERLRCTRGKMTSAFANEFGGVDGMWTNLFLTTIIIDGFMIEDGYDAAVAFVDAVEARNKAKDEGAVVSKVVKVAVRSWTNDVAEARLDTRVAQQHRLAQILTK